MSTRFWIILWIFIICLEVVACANKVSKVSIDNVIMGTRASSELIADYAPKRLDAWVDYVDELKFYLAPSSSEKNESVFCNYFHYIFGPTSRARVEIYLNRIHSRDMLVQCIAHEVGHHIDYILEEVSQTDLFQRAVTKSLEMLADLPEGPYHWRMFGDMISRFPGVNGNPRTEISNWGGYRELYARLHEVNYLIQIPPPLQVYYKDFIPWIWYQN